MDSSAICGIKAVCVLIAVCVTATLCNGQATTQPAELSPFEQAMAQADAATDRDERVGHLRRALSYRPGDPANIEIEFRIGYQLLIFETNDGQRISRSADALVVFKNIILNYRHMDYYTERFLDSPHSSSLIVPRAAMYASQLEARLNKDYQKAQEYALLALTCLNETAQQRIVDWNAWVDRPLSPYDNPHKHASRQAYYKERKADAATGDVFNPPEMTIVRMAVKQFGSAHAPQSPEELPATMKKITELFPDTAIARAALEHAEQATTQPAN